jgi:hypothetical protein
MQKCLPVPQISKVCLRHRDRSIQRVYYDLYGLRSVLEIKPSITARFFNFIWYYGLEIKQGTLNRYCSLDIFE